MSDEKGERKYFRCKRFVGNGIDLSKLSLRIVFQNASGLETGKDKYIVTDLATDGEDYVTFSWELSRKVTAYKGIISFIVCAIKTNTNGTITNEWNTTIANGLVLDGLEVNGTQEQEEVAKDYYNQLEAELLKVANEQKTELEKKAQEVIKTIPSDYTQMQKDVSSLKEVTANIHQASSLIDFENIKWIKNAYIDQNTGKEIFYANWVATDYIELSPQKLACAHLNDDGVFSVFAGHVYYAWYDSNKKYLIGGNVASILTYFDVNAKYIRLSFANNQITHVVLNTEAVIDALMGKDVSYFVPYGKIKIFNEANIERTRKDVDYLYSKLPEDLSNLDVEKKSCERRDFQSSQ